MEALGSFLAFVFMTVVYFVPTYVAIKRNHHNKMAIFVLNLFLGITFIGWAVALVWAVMKTVPEEPVPADKAQSVTPDAPAVKQSGTELKSEPVSHQNNHAGRNTVSAAMEKLAAKNNSKPVASEANDTSSADK
ncbi:MAG: superinfection immunity protein [Candidatus Auribacter fodinae]|jgi:hypothetical protein|uniref:Superinfection immunity protein n=1 Tax=Candidatus Auribacter fodinae TaxID=2093366 RepID=A0A3A4RE09_9BACT|nr:MAG: superinfection immunity protein [Candidatus Auribacter fodinae]